MGGKESTNETETKDINRSKSIELVQDALVASVAESQKISIVEDEDSELEGPGNLNVVNEQPGAQTKNFITGDNFGESSPEKAAIPGEAVIPVELFCFLKLI